MSGEIKKMFGHAGVYSIGIILNRAISFLMLPVYTRYLTPADYGIIELLEMTVDVVSIITGLGIVNGLAKFYYQYSTREEKNELVSTLFLLVIGMFLLTGSLGMFSSPWISQLVFGTKAYTYYIIITFLNLFFQILVYVPMSFVRTQQKSMFFVLASSIKLLIQLSLNILLVVYFQMGVLGVLYSSLCSSVLIGGWLAFHTFSSVRWSFSRAKASALFEFGWPFIFTALGTFILTYSDRYFLNYYQNLSDVGLYALAYKFGFLLMMFPVSPLMSIWMIQRFELASNEGYEKVFNQFLRWFFIITLTVGLAMSLLVFDVLKIMSAAAFWNAAWIAPIIILAYFLQACTDFFNFGIYHSGKTKHMAYATFLSVVVILILSFLLIPPYGTYGAAWATLIAFVVRLIYVYRISQRLFHIPYEWEWPIKTGILAVVTYLLYWIGMRWFSIGDSLFGSLSTIGFLMVSYFWLLGQMKIISIEERKVILRSIRAPVKALGAIRGESVT